MSRCGHLVKMSFDLYTSIPRCTLFRSVATMSTFSDLQDAVACAVTTALRNSGYSIDSEEEGDSTRCVL